MMVFTLLATNYLQKLDNALIRVGRFDEKIKFENLNSNDIKEFIYKKLDGKINKDEKLDNISQTLRYSNYSTLEQILDNHEIVKKKIVTEKDILQVYIDEKYGVSLKNYEMKDEKLTAYHEIGHSFIAYKSNLNVQYINIEPRSNSLGFCIITDIYDHKTKNTYLDEIRMALGGRAAEYVFNNKEVTSGASADINHATSIAKLMIYELCLFINDDYINKENYYDLGVLDYNGFHELSDLTKSKLESQVVQIINDEQKKSISIIQENKDLFEYLTKKLVEMKKMSGLEFINLIKNFEKNNKDKEIKNKL